MLVQQLSPLSREILKDGIMKLPPDKVVEYFFQFVLITSGIVTTILLVTAVTRLFVADAAALCE
jgi:hypothetical protein